mgnify:CR=1 FL=1
MIKLDNSSYFNYSKQLIISAILLFPFIIIYEIISFFKFYDKEYIIRNSADAILREIFSYFTFINNNYYSVLLLIFLLFVIFYHRDEFINLSIKVNFLIFMLVEGFLFGVILLFLLNDNSLIFKYNFSLSNDIILAYYLCVGAGIWEEVLFRLLLLNIVVSTISYINIKEEASTFIAIFIVSIIFSAFHYIGQNPDVFSYYSFSIRFIGGFILGYIYIFRGLGIASMTHFTYDLLLYVLPAI